MTLYGAMSLWFGSGLLVASAGVSVIILIIGILHILAAIGIWAHKGWSRWLGIILGVLGTLAGTGFVGAQTPLPLVAYGFVLIAMIFGGSQFRRVRVG